MKLSSRARYSLRLMLELCKADRDTDEDNTITSIKVISENTCISRKYLEQLAVVLRNAGLIKSVTGKTGGLSLAKRPSEISVVEIVEATIGPLSIVDCVTDLSMCDRRADCECSAFYQLIQKKLKDIMSEYKLSDLLDESFVDEVRKYLGSEGGEAISG